MNTATNQTTLFVFYKNMVADAAKVSVEALDAHLPRLGRAFDMGEPVWMIAEEMALRCAAPRKMKTPRELAARVVRA